MRTPAPSWELPAAMWEALESLLPVVNARRGRPRRVDLKIIAAGIFVVLRTGIKWQALPRERYGPSSTVYYYFRQWEEAGVFEELWSVALARCDKEVGIDWRWQRSDGGMTKAPLAGERRDRIRPTGQNRGPSAACIRTAAGYPAGWWSLEPIGRT